jgi:hypothetical protein
VRETCSEMAVAMVSANVQHATVRQAQELGASFIGKPFSDGVLSSFHSGATACESDPGSSRPEVLIHQFPDLRQQNLQGDRL